ncbi:MAG: hypothetical protein ACU0CA_05145 [Paracoccaceae bacterium]
MTNRIALAIALFIFILLSADYLLNDGQASLFLGRKFLTLIEYMKFWR